MDNQISIIGLGQIGASVGMALGEFGDAILRVGYDRSQEVVDEAKRKGVVDKVSSTLTGSIEESDIILLALPMHEIRPALEEIADKLKPRALVVDTAPLKRPVLEWSQEILPEECYYVGFTPVLNPDYLHEDQFGIQAARQDLFHGGMMAVVSGSRVDEEALRVATNLIELLGADPFFVDAAEIDGLMTMTYIMPRLLAASLLNATLSKPGWQEGRKIAGRAYARVSGPLTPVDEPTSLASIVMNNQENVIRVIDDVIATLKEFRRDVDEGNQQLLLDTLTKVQEGRDLWWKDRLTASENDREGSHVARGGNLFSRLFGIGRPGLSTEDDEA